MISSAGNGVYFVGARSTWYPRSAAEFSTYDLTFRYPKKLTLVTAGELVDDRTEGETRITRRSSTTPIRFAGFNLGNYERITGSAPGFTVEVYGNRGLEAALQPKAGLTQPDPSTRSILSTRRDPLQRDRPCLLLRPILWRVCTPSRPTSPPRSNFTPACSGRPR